MPGQLEQTPRSCIKGFLRAKKLWVNPPKAERAKPSLSSDYNLLFKNKIGERSLDIHRFSPGLGTTLGGFGAGGVIGGRTGFLSLPPVGTGSPSPHSV